MKHIQSTIGLFILGLFATTLGFADTITEDGYKLVETSDEATANVMVIPVASQEDGVWTTSNYKVEIDDLSNQSSTSTATEADYTYYYSWQNLTSNASATGYLSSSTTDSSSDFSVSLYSDTTSYDGSPLTLTTSTEIAAGTYFINSSQITNAVAYTYGIDGVFINNTISGSGGAINNTGSMSGDISGVFINNSANNGGAIFSNGSIAGTISGLFVGNFAKNGKGGAIYNNTNGTMYAISGDFIGNSAYVSSGVGYGGAIYNNGTITTISDSNFIENAADSGGAIYNNANTIDSISGSSFTNNTATSNGGAIFNTAGTITEITNSSFTNNTASVAGGAIYNTGTIGTISNVDFINNTTTTNGGAAIYNTTGSIGSISGTFIGNTATANVGGAIVNSGTGGTIGGYDASTGYYGISATFINNTSGTNGGAIYAGTGSSTYIIDSSFAGNCAANGGALYNKGASVYLIASASDTTFTGNTASTSGDAIYNTGTINFEGTGNGYKIIVNDGIDGSEGTLAINSGTTAFNNTVSGNTITVYSGATLELGSYAGTSDLYGIGGEDSALWTSVSASSAAISSSLTINSGAVLKITNATGSDSVSVTSLTLESGSTLYMAASSSLSLDSASNISISTGEFSVTFIAGYGATISIDGDELSLYEFLSTEKYLDAILGVDIDSDVLNIADEVTGLAAGEEYVLVLSGTYENGTYSNVTLSNVAVPEPSTYAMILGVLALGFAYYRKRK